MALQHFYDIVRDDAPRESQQLLGHLVVGGRTLQDRRRCGLGAALYSREVSRINLERTRCLAQRPTLTLTQAAQEIVQRSLGHTTDRSIVDQIGQR